MSYNKLGFTSGQTLKAEHLNHMEDGIAKATTPSWNDLADKPFYSELVEGAPEFNGDLTDKEYIDVGDGILTVKMSDTPLTMEQLLGSTVVVKLNGSDFGVDEDTIVEFVATEENIMMQQLDESSYMLGIIYNDMIPVVYVVSGDLSSMGVPLTDGVYFIYAQMDTQYIYAQSLSCLNGMQEVVHKIDEKYLPEVGLKADEVATMIDETVPTMIDEAVAKAITGAIGGSY